MHVVFLPSSNEDVRWFKRYYKTVFPEGSKRANASMDRTLSLLVEQPRLGRPEPDTSYFRLAIIGTPFVIKYQITDDRIEILRVADGRANPKLNDQGPNPQ